jgi:rRNA biogenesis protein RRP5
VSSVEDHGYILDLGVSGVSGFLSFKDDKKSRREDAPKLRIGQLIDISITKLSGNGRTCNVATDRKMLHSASVRQSHKRYSSN